jgi:hypothetical protein
MMKGSELELDYVIHGADYKLSSCFTQIKNNQGEIRVQGLCITLKIGLA